ncbi:uncharacterized protein LOC106648017 isoform X1 [Trichogramma pretiosum]|uniref:uncharacterized protein LOC106648017 isoform X1 n=2 Tax=Trichogramma pretiosum TaxID=7493 RepID=UPI0006C96EFD|nr:uncharacterized protein LOC106648017 isoform X1 [Trichogramma pretiosum]
MKCFKSFFKHTWQPQQMENSSRRGHCSYNETELGEIKVQQQAFQVPAANRSLACHNGACKGSSAAAIKIRPEQSLDSPWHYSKTLFLLATILAFVLWIFVYVLLNRYELL